VCFATAVLPVGALGVGGEVLVGIGAVKRKSDMHTVVADVIDRGLKIGLPPGGVRDSEIVVANPAASSASIAYTYWPGGSCTLGSVGAVLACRA